MMPATSPVTKLLRHPAGLAFWCVLAAFGTYAAMYGFRKPFTAAGFKGTEFGDSLKVWYVTTQVIGYMCSKFIGIKIVSEMVPKHRARVLLGLIVTAWFALIGFALTPAPWNAAWLFLNGLPLGMVFGLVLGFLEGRRMTEFFVAGLCASFILADGITKDVGTRLVRAGIPEMWMPAAAGALFLLPLFVFVWMLTCIPAPDAADVEERSARTPMKRAERMALIRRHGFALLAIVACYMLITIVRSIRADFAPEIWKALGVVVQPEIFTRSEFWVGLMVILCSGALVLVHDNRRAFFLSLWMGAGGLVLALAAIALVRAGSLGPFPFMVLLGIGMYLPYVIVHTTVFERLIALTREKGNIGFLMTFADAIGYLGYVLVMLSKSRFQKGDGFLGFFLNATTFLLGAGLILLLLSIRSYAARTRNGEID